MNHKLQDNATLLTSDGKLAIHGYSNRFHVIYNKEVAKIFPARLKEWDFYQFQKGDWVVQMTLGHLTYVGQANINLLNIKTGEKHSIGVIKPFFRPALGKEPKVPQLCEYKQGPFHMTYEITPTQRILDFKGSDKHYSSVCAHFVLENDPNNDVMVIATPFRDPTQFYLNCKENYYTVTGSICFDDRTVDMDGATGVMDWGRGIWPFRHDWYWGSLSSHIDGVPFGINIGWGFGDLQYATENFFFYDKKGYKLGGLHTEWDLNDVMKEQHIYDEEHKMDFIFKPFFNHETELKAAIVHTHCDQVYGTFTGYILTDEGKVEFQDLVGFIEHAKNRW